MRNSLIPSWQRNRDRKSIYKTQPDCRASIKQWPRSAGGAVTRNAHPHWKHGGWNYGSYGMPSFPTTRSCGGSFPPQISIRSLVVESRAAVTLLVNNLQNCSSRRRENMSLTQMLQG